AAFAIRVEDAVHDAPVVDGTALRVLGVRIRAAPFERGRAVAGRQQVVRAEVDLRRAEPAQLREQLPAVLHGRVVGLVRADEAPEGLEPSQRPPRVDGDGDGERAVAAGSAQGETGSEEEPDGGESGAKRETSSHQKLNLSPSWTWRGVLNVLVTRPAVAVSTVLLGALQLGVFLRLKTSRRNSTFSPKRLNTEKSRFL